MYSAASITITPAAGSSSGQAIEAVGEFDKKSARRRGLDMKWTSCCLSRNSGW